MDSIPKGYKNTDIGVIPEDWRTVLLGKKATLKARIGWQGLTTAEYKESGEYYLITGTEFTNGFINWAECNYIEKKRYDQDRHIQVKAKDVLVTKDGTIGKVAYVKGLMKPATLNSGVFVIRPTKNSFKPEYFYHILSSSIFRRFLAELSAGSTINHLYQKDFVKFVFQVPEDSAEQDSISTALSNIDSLITSLEKLVEKKKMIKQGVMQELLTGKMRLAGFSGEWIVANYLDLFNKVSIRNKQLDSSFYSEIGKFPIVDQGSDLIIAYTNDKSKVLQCPSDGLIIFGDHTRYIKYINFDFVIGADGVQVLECKPNLSTKFVYYAMQLFKIPNTGYNRHFKYLKEVELEIPSDVVEQTTIATFLTNLDLEIEILKSKLSKLKQIKQGAMQQLLTGKIRLINK